MERCYDAVVVGAGPAGSAVARDIAGEGFAVLLLEEHDVIGRPLQCSGLVTARALELAGVGDEVVQNEIRGAIVCSPGGRELHLGGDKVYALAIDRVRMDQSMAIQAQEHGAELCLGTRFVALEHDGGLARIHVERKGRRSSFLTKVIIGSDGALSRVARQLGVHRLDGMVRGLSVEVRAQGRWRDHVTTVVDRSLTPGWFAWAIPLGDGRVRVGTGTTNGIKPIDSLRELQTRFPQHFPRGEVLGFAAGGIPLWAPLRSYGDNVLLVGDAARQVKPASGGGIYTGLVGARHAARSAVEALRCGDFSGRFLSRYQKGFMSELGDELKRGSDLHRVLSSLSNHQIERLLSVLSSDRLRRVILARGDIDFPSRLFYELVKLAPALVALVRAPLRFPGAWLRWRRGRSLDQSV
jgi:digeranylgeranylglycerophospholipid reductase